MPIGVVVHFKIVDIKHTDRKSSLEADSFLPFYDAVLVVVPPVRYLRQIVFHNLLLNPQPVLVLLHMGIYPSLDNDRVERFDDIIHCPQKEPMLFAMYV